MIPTKKKILFILNPVAGGGKSLALESDINEYLDHSLFDHEIKFTSHKGHAAELAGEAVIKNYNIVVAVGGDGTINEMAKPLLHTHTALGIIPRGSGNGLARHLDIPMKMESALKKINTGIEKRIDVLQVNDLISVNVSGIGFDGWVAHEFAKTSTRGFLNYARLTLNGFKKFPQCQVKINADGTEHEYVSFITAIANSSQFGNNAFVAPMADIQDGIMDITVVKKPPLMHLPVLFYRLFKKEINKSRYVSILRAKKVHIELREKLPIHIDGEPVGNTNKITAIVLPQALKVWC